MAIFIPDLFTGYMNGREKAISANWDDLDNYNNTLNGQLQNAYTMEVFDPNVRNAWNSAAQSDISLATNAAIADNTINQARTFAQAGGNQAEVNSRIAQLQATIAKAQAELQQLMNPQQQPQLQGTTNTGNASKPMPNANLSASK